SSRSLGGLGRPAAVSRFHPRAWSSIKAGGSAGRNRVATTRTLSAPNDIPRGIVFMLIAVSMFPVINASAKFLSTTGGYPISQIVWARFLGHLVFVVLAFYPRLGASLFATARPLMQIARSMLLLVSTVMF